MIWQEQIEKHSYGTVIKYRNGDHTIFDVHPYQFDEVAAREQIQKRVLEQDEAAEFKFIRK